MKKCTVTYEYLKGSSSYILKCFHTLQYRYYDVYLEMAVSRRGIDKTWTAITKTSWSSSFH